MKIEVFLEKYTEEFGLLLVAGKDGVDNEILFSTMECPGLTLAGYLTGGDQKRILIFGESDIGYLKTLDTRLCLKRLQDLLTDKIPLVIVSSALDPLKEMIALCEERRIPLVQAQSQSKILMNRLTMYLDEYFAPKCCCHGSFVEIFNMGVLIQGDSAVGKSEAALGLIEKGHRLIADDLVRFKKLEWGGLEGFGSEISRHYMEVRGIGIIDVTNLYGTVSVKEKKILDIVVKLEVWDDSHFYDRAGLEQKTISMLGVDVPYHILPVKLGRDVVHLLEIIASNHRLQKVGHHAAKELERKLLAAMKEKSRI